MSVFITGTDTGVGKTVVTAGLAAAYRKAGRSVCVYKPVQTGSADPEHPEDPETVNRLLREPVPTYCTYSFPIPAAPYVADEAGIIDVGNIILAFKRLKRQYEVVLVEGAGGLRVPVTARQEMIDLMALFNLPVLLVSRATLGTINHTLLSVEVLQHRGLPLRGVVVSGFDAASTDPAVRTLPEVLTQLLPVPLLALLPPLELSPGCFSSESPNLGHFEDLSNYL